MTENRTSQAAEEMRTSDSLALLPAPVRKAIAEKYKRMEEKMDVAVKRLEAGYPEGSQLAIDLLQEALAFDPLSQE